MRLQQDTESALQNARITEKQTRPAPSGKRTYRCLCIVAEFHNCTIVAFDYVSGSVHHYPDQYEAYAV